MANVKVTEKQARELVKRLERVNNDLDGIVREIATTKETSNVFWRRINRQIRKYYDEARFITSTWVDETLPRSYRKAMQVQIAKLKERTIKMPNKIGFRELANKDSIRQSILSLVSETNATFGTGYLSGQRTMTRLASLTQQVNLRERQIEKAIADGFIEKGSVRGPTKNIQIQLLKKSLDGKYITIINKNGKQMQFTVKGYSELVARTKLIETSSQAVVDTTVNAGFDLVQVSSHNTDTPICQEFEGKIFSLSGNDKDFPAATNLPPYHPNCVLDGTFCKPAGRLISGLSCRYKGDVIEFKFAKGGSIAVTINHMFLTPNGFVAAKYLRQGDNIFYCPDFQRISFGYPDINGDETRIENIIRSLSKSGGVLTRRMPISAEDIHGDGEFINGDINIIWAKSFLRNSSKPGFIKHIIKNIFKPRDIRMFLLSRFSNFASMFKSLAFAFDSSMGISRNSQSFLLRRFAISDISGFRKSTQFNSGKDKIFANCHPVNGKNITNILKRFAGFIQIDNITNIKRYSFHGNVYSLETDSTLYVSNGMLSSNCKHSLTTVIKEGLEAQGTLEKYSDFSRGETEVHPTRTAHIPVSQR